MTAKIQIKNNSSPHKSFIAVLLVLCASQLLPQQPTHEVKHPEWSNNQTIYEVNLRQYSVEGRIKAIEISKSSFVESL